MYLSPAACQVVFSPFTKVVSVPFVAKISYTDPMPQPKLNQIRGRVLAWYRKNRRDLPWRRTRDPYAIWVAETMLQQTQVKTVLPYYRRFLKAFPTLAALDRGSKAKTLALWSGLGYYRRAENLKKAARIIVRDHRGKMPRHFDALRALPGVGPYTAGALMSIAFNRVFPALDANARRVLARIFNVRGEKELWDVGSRLIPRSRPGDWNQALMELGATICVARDPECPLCPISQFCATSMSGCFQSKAPSAAKRRAKRVQWPLAVIQNNKKILLRRRPAAGLLGGLWEVPGGERKKRESVKAALTRHLNGLGKIVSPASLAGEVRHSITYRRIRAPVFFFSQYRKGLRSDSSWRWVSPSSLYRYPLTTLSRKAIKLVTER